MRELKLNEEEFRLLKKYMKLGRYNFPTYNIEKKTISRSMFGMAREFYKISEEDYYKIRSLEEKIERVKRVRVRYDKNKTERHQMLEKQK